MIEFSAGGPVGEEEASALVVGVGEDLALDDAASWVVEQVAGLRDRFESREFTGKESQQLAVTGGGDLPYQDVVFVGLGADADAETVRRAMGSAIRGLDKAPTVATSLHQAAGGGAGAVAMGALLGAYSYERHKSEPKPSKIESVILLGGADEDVAAADEAAIVADAVMLARDLVNEPAMYKSPERMAAIASEMAGEVGLEIRVLDEGDIESEGLGGLGGVSLGATNPPRLVELRYEPEGAEALLAVVGKGIVFDSGGLSIKQASSMEEMKTDMSGAAAVFGAVKAIARLGLKVRVLGITPLTENMPGGADLRQGGVLHTHKGKTIEVLNTDAEGRLVLADGLALAVEEEPDLLVDIATLTGACMVALGRKIAGVFGTDDAVAKVMSAAEEAGERLWRLPMPDDYRKLIDSDVADMRNTAGGERYGGAITAALLLREFAGDGPWAHLDIAGPARAKEAEGYVVKGGTGFGVRTIVELARRMASE